MSEIAEKILPTLYAMTQEDRAYIAHCLMDTLDEDEEAEFIAELNRRVANYLSGKDPGIPAEEVHRNLREKYG